MNKLLTKTQLYLKRNSPTLLSIAAAAGVIATAVSAVMATPKAVKLIERAEDEKGEKLTKTEVIKTAGLIYIPTIAIGASTIFCILSADILNRKKQACLISAYNLLDRSLKNYRNSLTDIYGKDADKKIMKTIIQNNKAGDIDVDSDGKALFYDLYSERYFRRTIEEVQAAEYHLNRNFALKGWATLNEFYEFLGLEKTKIGEALGWSLDMGLAFYGYVWIDFEHELAELDDGLVRTFPDGKAVLRTSRLLSGSKCYIINMPFNPTADYDEDVDNIYDYNPF